MAVKPQQTTLEYTRGDTDPIEFTRLTADGSRKDITGFSYRFTVDTLPDPLGAATNVFTVPGTLIDAPNGELAFLPTAVQTDQTAPKTYYYDVEETDAAGRVTTIAKGEWRLKQDISK